MTGDAVAGTGKCGHRRFVSPVTAYHLPCGNVARGIESNTGDRAARTAPPSRLTAFRVTMRLAVRVGRHAANTLAAVSYQRSHRGLGYFPGDWHRRCFR